MFKKFKEQLADKINVTKSYYGFGVSETLNKFTKEVNKLLVDREFFDDEFFEDFEEKLIELDIVPNLAITIRDELEKKIYNSRVNKKNFDSAFAELITKIVNVKEAELTIDKDKQNVWLVIGVNGVGKTTSISKLVNLFKDSDPLLVEADTFRAGAIDQLNEWANRLGVDIVKTHQGHAPSAVIYQAMDEANEADKDLVICDTAGRLHNQDDLMQELGKIHKIIKSKTDENVVLKTILVLDGTAGKNTIQQAQVFNEITEIDGVIVTKLDSGGKAGMIINISYEIDVPVYYLTTGEQIEDIRKFDYQEYIKGLLVSDED
ncbi:MAG: signal recognition particle-docking protein FtsY [Dysgonomonas sp.]